MHGRVGSQEGALDRFAVPCLVVTGEGRGGGFARIFFSYPPPPGIFFLAPSLGEGRTAPSSAPVLLLNPGPRGGWGEWRLRLGGCGRQRGGHPPSSRPLVLSRTTRQP